MALSAQTDTPRTLFAARREPLSSPAAINIGLDTTFGRSTASDNPRQGLPMKELTLPQLLKPAGYVCGAIGKWHLGYVPDLYPTRRGFDEFFGFLDAGSPYYNAELFRDETPLIEPAYLTDAFTREGVSFINRHATQPFFLYLAYNAVHTPYDQASRHLYAASWIYYGSQPAPLRSDGGRAGRRRRAGAANTPGK